MGTPDADISPPVQGCSVRQSVKTPATQQLSEDILKVQAVQDIRFAFTRPDFTIEIKANETPDEKQMNAILERVKGFSTVENLQEVAKSIKWNDMVSHINLVIYKECKNRPITKYSAGYYKTFDMTDGSEANLDRYCTWTKD